MSSKIMLIASHFNLQTSNRDIGHHMVDLQPICVSTPIADEEVSMKSTYDPCSRGTLPQPWASSSLSPQPTGIYDTVS
jgi:hypothetical protein